MMKMILYTDFQENLAAAALQLFRFDRDKSAAIILSELSKTEGGFQIFEQIFEDTIRQGQLKRALICLDAMAENASDKSVLDFAWKLIEQATVEKQMQPYLFDIYLRHIACKQASAINPDGPDLCYVLAMSLPEVKTGYSMRTQALVTVLQNTGMTVHCLTRPGFPWHRDLEGPAEPQQVGTVTYHRSGDRTHRIPSSFASFRAAESELLKQFSRIRPKAVMAGSNHANAIPAMLAARRLGLPFIYDVRGFWEYSRAAKQPEWANSNAFRFACKLEARTAEEADMVLTLNEPMKDELVSRGVSIGRIVLAPNAADPDALMPIPRSAALAHSLHIPDDVPVIGYVGSFNSYEGLEDLMIACGILAMDAVDFRLMLVGGHSNPESSVLTALRDLAETLGIADRLILPGYVPNEDVADWYSLIDIAPLPRKATDVTKIVSPLKPFEAMAMAKTVIVSNLPALTEIVDHGRTGLVFDGTIPDLAKTLKTVLSDAGLRQRLGRRAREWIVANRTWIETVRPIEAAVKDLIFLPSKDPGRRSDASISQDVGQFPNAVPHIPAF